MSTFQYASTSTSSEAFSTPTGGANAFPWRSGWTSSTADNERSVKRQNSAEHSGAAFVKRQRTPSSSLTTNNGHVSTSVRHSSGTECDDRGGGYREDLDMNDNDVVRQRNLAVIQDGSPAVSEVKVSWFTVFCVYM